MGAAVVVIILFFMMGLKLALLVASALPLILLMALPVLNILEVPLHQISLTELIIALGLLIDNASVAIDDYSQARVGGLDRATSIAVTVRHLFIPLVASTVTTTLTFLSLVLLPGNLAEIAAVETPMLDRVLSWCQEHMGKEYLLGDRLCGRDLGETAAPQAFGISDPFTLVSRCTPTASD